MTDKFEIRFKVAKIRFTNKSAQKLMEMRTDDVWEFFFREGFDAGRQAERDAQACANRAPRGHEGRMK